MQLHLTRQNYEGIRAARKSEWNDKHNFDTGQTVHAIVRIQHCEPSNDDRFPVSIRFFAIFVVNLCTPDATLRSVHCES